ncbi:OmpA family protein [Sulfitobacter sp. F26169L]|uniref:OmpA family protein n=1 Tax=Sulfitobacter sp. F26169L TaxID=2996015 RepID=UPI0022609ABC|nr:OmpA family protein [Sulfitobacter sp. F26169L]MCX7566616.1 OmpA family protein [Sulfitobacter sp. F26169L]
MKRYLVAVMVMFAGAAQAVDLQLPVTARQIITRDTVQDRYLAPVAPFADGVLPVRQFEGDIARSAWRIDVAGLTPLQVLLPLRKQLSEAGFRIVLDCAAVACGGYDFRFATEVLPAPSMYVNIRNFHVLTALRGAKDAPTGVVNILASASSGTSFVQIIQAGQSVTQDRIEAVAELPDTVGTDQSMAEILAREGRVVLEGLDFATGTSDLGAGPFPALDALVKTLRNQSDMRVALVGHTDNVGSLDGNIVLSRSRADAVRARLIENYDVAPEKLEAEGMGYLAPHTTNLTEAGREVNRRVEAVVLAP